MDVTEQLRGGDVFCLHQELPLCLQLLAQRSPWNKLGTCCLVSSSRV